MSALIDINYLSLWPVVVTLEDVYVPELAAQALEAFEAYGEDFWALKLHCEAVYATRDVENRRN